MTDFDGGPPPASEFDVLSPPAARACVHFQRRFHVSADIMDHGPSPHTSPPHFLRGSAPPHPRCTGELRSCCLGHRSQGRANSPQPSRAHNSFLSTFTARRTKLCIKSRTAKDQRTEASLRSVDMLDSKHTNTQHIGPSGGGDVALCVREF